MQTEAQKFAHDVANEMYRLRGWSKHSVTPEVRDDVFATMHRHNRVYSTGLLLGLNPVPIARTIQKMEWTRVATENGRV